MHYSIIVAGDDYEEQLAPFQENNMDDCPNTKTRLSLE